MEKISEYLETKERKNYQASLKKLASGLAGNDKEIALNFCKWQNESYEDEYIAKIRQYLEGDDMGACFSGDHYKILVTLLGEEWAIRALKIVKRRYDYIYMRDYDRRSYRSKKDKKLYLNCALSAILGVLNIREYDLTLEEYIKYSDNLRYNDIVSDIIAVEIDEGNEKVFNLVKGFVYDNTGTVSYQIIKGLLKTHREDCYQIVGDLLKAAKLQEGLRQAVAESIDESSIEGFKYMLKILVDNDLARFSSILRALCTWTGLSMEEERPATVKKALESAYQCLTDEGYRKKCLEGKNNIDIYLALWARGNYEIVDATSDAEAIIQSNAPKYKLLVAACFLSETNTHLPHKTISSLIEQHINDLDIIAWILKNAPETGSTWSFEDSIIDFRKQTPETLAERQKVFAVYKKALETMSGKEVEVKEGIFPWLTMTLSADDILDRMIQIAAYQYEIEFIEDILQFYDKMGNQSKEIILGEFLEFLVPKKEEKENRYYSQREEITKLFEKVRKIYPKTNKQREFVFTLLGDKSMPIRESALKIAERMELNDKEIVFVENLLALKTGGIRQMAINTILSQENNVISTAVTRLAFDKKEEKRMGGIEIVNEMKGKEQYKDIYLNCTSMVWSIQNPSSKEKILLDKLLDKKENASNTKANGYGLFDTSVSYNPPALKLAKEIDIQTFLQDHLPRAKELLKSLSALIQKNKDYEYTSVNEWSDSSSKVVLGAQYSVEYVTLPEKDCKSTLDNYPLTEIWRNFFTSNKVTFEELICIDFFASIDEDCYQYRKDEMKSTETKILNDTVGLNLIKEICTLKNKLEFQNHIECLVSAYSNEVEKDLKQKEQFELMFGLCNSILQRTPVENWKYRDEYYDEDEFDSITECVGTAFWFDKTKDYIYDDQSFTQNFNLLYDIYKKNEYKTRSDLGLYDFARACNLGLIKQDEIYAEIFSRNDKGNYIRSLTDQSDYKDEKLDEFTFLKEITTKSVEKILEIELARGDLKTDVSELASNIERVDGTQYFVKILKSMDKETFVRGYIYDSTTKKQSLSQLLKCCHPKKDEDETTLKTYLKESGITNKRLIEAAMYAPQWIETIGKHLKMENMSLAAWYFHAHINESFSAEKETFVARYSPISPEDFNDGAFDIDWFKAAYEGVGKENFEMLYDCAKYISGGANHRRSQLFSDAVIGKLDKKDAEKKIKDSRNKDTVLAYSLIPLDKKDAKKDLLARYELLQAFLKESRAFGAQRRESEAKVSNIALGNLGRNAGFADINRFIWNMETEKFKAASELFKPKSIGSVECFIEIDAEGKASVKTIKAGKELKSIPADLKKDPYILELAEKTKSFKDQYSRARRSLENAMEKEDAFTKDELSSLINNPVIAPLLMALVWKCDTKFGYFTDGELVDQNGKKVTTDKSASFIIAHPVHLMEAKIWAAFQADIVQKQLVQPFKQIFRELYTINADELAEKTISRRYAGNQVMPKKTVALLKSRLWTVDMEEGLQKVYYKENIIAKIYALADWYSPADVESPTIETVCFYDRKTLKPIQFVKLPKVIFSEVMRDVDLVVSVAHAGGVDPEASHSTIEMRSAIISGIMPLFKLSNVKIEGSHAHIKGTFGEYVVHLGSGVCHKQAKGSVNIIPVHSQQRGKHFLPFVDDDPKTAEIITKILFLARDNEIKDPNILAQIKE